ncbi:MAG: hypothetical protein CL463_06625 [Acidimicrobiaceae bacterium]|nr:hypothetical protein [Acidimicrobiaceae bacterium]
MILNDWVSLSKRAAFISHRLVGWVYWEPHGIERYAALGVPNGFGYYVTTRAGLLGKAGPDIVAAAYHSIHPDFIKASYDHLSLVGTVEDAMWIRDEAVLHGLQKYVPDICGELSSMAGDLWEAAESLPISGRIMFASQLRHRRPDEPLLNAWLAINCIREWRGDTHWAIQIADGLSGTESGVLDGAWRDYDDDWLPRSRGADDTMLEKAYFTLEQRGFAEDGKVTDAGIKHRLMLETRLDEATAPAWQYFGEEKTTRLIDLVDSIGEVLMERIDETAGKKWMPAAR